MAFAHDQEWDAVVVGSGAGGGTLAARLVESGWRVFLLEAGDDARTSADGDSRLPDDYDVPAFHPFASENEAMRWDYRVRHYADAAQQALDWKSHDGTVLYPRAATLGGCTAHNAMIYLQPHDDDWNAIARLTGDATWRASHMRRYVRRLEDCRHRPGLRALARLGLDPSGHGWHGWLPTERAVPLEALFDDAMIGLILDTARKSIVDAPHPLASLARLLHRRADPNARWFGRGEFEGVCYTPLSTSGHRRSGARERLLAVQAKHPDRLHIETRALATRMVLDDDLRAVGVDYLRGARLYGAHASPSGDPGEPRRARARREVVLCAGAFNTPQLLMLSGIGPADALRAQGIASRIDLGGVGRNLQDRYEVPLTYRLSAPWAALAGARFERGDAAWREWDEQRAGMYVSSGATVAMIWRSSPQARDPDLFAMALPTRFEGYFPGYSKWLPEYPDVLTWAVLKAHTRNRAGAVRLRSSDPRATPEVDFHYFDAGDDPAREDLGALVDAVHRVRRVMAPLLEAGLVVEEQQPGAAVQGDEAIAAWIRAHAWGHHASCSCPIGAAASGGVVDSRLRVHGAKGLRVVDASVFPRIPGFFIASAIYMVAEKAADAMRVDAASSDPSDRSRGGAAPPPAGAAL